MIPGFIKTLPKIYWLFFITLIVKLILLPFAQVTDADAVTRVLITLNWLEDPHWMQTAIWAPFHFYLNGFALLIWDDTMFSPVLVSILFSCFTILPFYFFVRREFNATGAFYATLFLIVSPTLFRLSFLALAETPFLFFIALTMNLISKGIRENKIVYMILAGLTMTMAAGFRYEGWMLIGILGLVIILSGKWKFAFIFGIVASIFPIIWMISNYEATGDTMHSINGNYRYTIELLGNNDNISFENHLRRIWFFPFSLLIAIGPPVAFLALKHLFKSGSKINFQKSKAIWSIPFWVLLTFYFYNAINGTLLLQHRFTAMLVLSGLPFIAEHFIINKIKQAILFSFLAIGLTFIYNSEGITPLPRLKDQNVLNISERLNGELDADSGLILDFLTWESTYYIALNSKLSPKKIVFIESEKNAKIPAATIKKLIKEQKEGLMLVKNRSAFSDFIRKKMILQFENNLVTFELLADEPNFQILKWKHHAAASAD